MIQGCLTLIIVIVVIFFVIGSNSKNSSTPTPNFSTPNQNELSPDEDLNRITFVRVCHEVITEQLKAPKTAQYRDSLDEKDAIAVVGNDLKLTSYVDAENSFGALLRTAFSCTYHRADKTVSGKLL